ncbi:hypothetical protein SAMN05428962_4373 [Paenibacillus sp. BC26]|nr:hypothetical protein SAMN05428962_4373 [Paenibacillus sp. BC26]
MFRETWHSTLTVVTVVILHNFTHFIGKRLPQRLFERFPLESTNLLQITSVTTVRISKRHIVNK